LILITSLIFTRDIVVGRSNLAGDPTATRVTSVLAIGHGRWGRGYQEKQGGERSAVVPLVSLESSSVMNSGVVVVEREKEEDDGRDLAVSASELEGEKGLGQFSSWAMAYVGSAQAKRRERERRGEPGLLFGWAGPRERKERFSLFYFQKFY
jgi:hypothetical protein